MECLLKLLFYISALHQINGYELTLEIKSFEGDSSIPFMVEKEMADDDLKPDKYAITFNQEVSEENDMPIKFSFSTKFDNENDNQVDASFCKDREDEDGDAVSLTALALGMSKKPPCPITSGSKFEQEQYFTIDTNDFPNIVFTPIGSHDDEYKYMSIEIGDFKALELIAMYNDDDNSN